MNISGEENQRPETAALRGNYDRHMRFFVMPILYKTTSRGHKKRMKELLSPFKSSQTLDIACGNNLCETILDRTNECTGLDISFGMLAEAKKRLDPAIHFSPVRGDAMKLPFGGGSFDLLTCSLGLHFVPDIGEAIAETGRVLKPGGVFVCCSPVMESGLFVDFYWRYYYEKGRFNAPIFEKDLREACSASGLRYVRHSKKGKLLYFTAAKE